MKGYNDDELIPLIEYGKRVNGEVRFIEYMDVGGANDWSADKVLSRKEILVMLSSIMGPLRRCMRSVRLLLSDFAFLTERRLVLSLLRPCPFVQAVIEAD